MAGLRDLIEVTYEDRTNYLSPLGADVGAIVIEADWGPAEVYQMLTFDDFMSLYPLSSNPTETWTNAYRAYQCGLQFLEVVRGQRTSVTTPGETPSVSMSDGYLKINVAKTGITDSGVSPGVNQPRDKEITDSDSLSDQVVFCIQQKYPGFFTGEMEGKGLEVSLEIGSPADLKSSGIINWDPWTDGPTKIAVLKVGIDLSTDTSEITPSFNSLAETFIFSPNREVDPEDGQNLAVDAVLTESKYFTGVQNTKNDLSFLTVNKIFYLANDGTFKYADPGSSYNPTDKGIKTKRFGVLNLSNAKILKPSELVSYYNSFFSSPEDSQASFLIEPRRMDIYNSSTNAWTTYSKSIADLAQSRSDCQYVAGYPSGPVISEEGTLVSNYTLKEIYNAGENSEPYNRYLAYWNSFGNNKFLLKYTVNEVVTFNNNPKQILSSGAGSVAGLYAAVGREKNLNQVPSARTYGGFSGSLKYAFPFTWVLEQMENYGINGVYTTTSGPRLFGVASGFNKLNSYFARANVVRVICNILKAAFAQAYSVIHVGNTSSLKQSVQSTLQVQLDQFYGQGVLRANSKVTCDQSNNLDVNTRGGRDLYIDYELWFVSLVERVKINIVATDSSVTATTTQG